MRNYKRDRRGRFARGGVVGSSPTPKARYRAAKKANSKAHRARVKGSVKARGKEIVTTAPRRSKNLVGGAAMYAGGRYMGSARAQSLGLDMARQGVKAGRGRVGATRAMSKGLKRSRNAQAKKEYFKATGKSQARRNVAKLAAVGVVGAAGLYAVKNGHIARGAHLGKNMGGADISLGKSKRHVASMTYGRQSATRGGGIVGNVYVQSGKRFKNQSFKVKARKVTVANW